MYNIMPNYSQTRQYKDMSKDAIRAKIQHMEAEILIHNEVLQKAINDCVHDDETITVWKRLSWQCAGQSERGYCWHCYTWAE